MDRLAITLPLPHFRQRNRLTNWAIGAPGLSPNRTRSSSGIMPRWGHLMQRTTITERVLFTTSRIAS
ncbi:MAG: hypothetical protein WAL37_02475 [Xanthobacteraceae bacterium]